VVNALEQRDAKSFTDSVATQECGDEALTSARLLAARTLRDAAFDGRLEAKLVELKRAKAQEEVERVRKDTKSFLISAASDGRLEMACQEVLAAKASTDDTGAGKLRLPAAPVVNALEQRDAKSFTDSVATQEFGDEALTSARLLAARTLRDAAFDDRLEAKLVELERTKAQEEVERVWKDMKSFLISAASDGRLVLAARASNEDTCAGKLRLPVTPVVSELEHERLQPAELLSKASQNGALQSALIGVRKSKTAAQCADSAAARVETAKPRGVPKQSPTAATHLERTVAPVLPTAPSCHADTARLFRRRHLAQVTRKLPPLRSSQKLDAEVFDTDHSESGISLATRSDAQLDGPLSAMALDLGVIAPRTLPFSPGPAPRTNSIGASPYAQADPLCPAGVPRHHSAKSRAASLGGGGKVSPLPPLTSHSKTTMLSSTPLIPLLASDVGAVRGPGAWGHWRTRATVAS